MASPSLVHAIAPGFTLSISALPSLRCPGNDEVGLVHRTSLRTMPLLPALSAGCHAQLLRHQLLQIFPFPGSPLDLGNMDQLLSPSSQMFPDIWDLDSILDEVRRAHLAEKMDEKPSC
jgi:hypothetical protein